MRYLLIILFCGVFTIAHASDKIASTIKELNEYASEAKAGDHIFLKDGVYKDAVIKFNNSAGTENAPVTVSAQHPGKVFLEGNSSISFSGQYIHIKDLVFQNGGHELKSKQVIEFRISEKAQASHCTISDCVINDFNNTIKTDVNAWVGIYGEYNVVERCLFKAKDNMGPTLVVWLDSSRAAHHTIAENYFLTRSNGAQVDNGLESIRIGDSKTSFTDAHCVIAFNRFEDCDGEIEIISNKSCHNSYLHNTFFNCDGGLTLRHGNHTLCDGNYFDGGKKKLSYGIRFIGEGHVAINNYFRNLHGASHELYRSPVSLLNGLINTPINGYYQVRNAVVTDNIFMDCETPLIRIGAFSPKRDGMSIAPDTVTIQNNVFVNSGNATGDVLEIITPALHFTVNGNKISKGYKVAQPGSFTEIAKGTEKSVTQSDYPAVLTLNKGVGAGWVLPRIREKMKGKKYTYLVPEDVGPTWGKN
ncbi:MAG: polysaccharide lyase 6 family protein [Bacteroidota bacterium]